MHEIHGVFETPKDVNAKIWRYMDLPKLVSLLDRDALFFAKASTLRDPYEGTIPKYNDTVREEIYQSVETVNLVKMLLKDAFKKFRETMVINSWHLNEYESAAMWQVYAQENAGIAIQTTYRRLCESFAHNTEDKVFIGKIRYTDFNKEWMEEGNAFNAFLIKRHSFDYEKELRAIIMLPLEYVKEWPTENNSFTKDGKYVKVNLDTLIERIYIAPFTLSPFEEIVKSVISKYRLNKEVIKSDLYTLT